MKYPSPPSPGARWLVAISLLVLGGIGLLYFWFTQPLARESRKPFHYYSELAFGFKSGQLFLPQQPSAALLALENPYDYTLRKEEGVEDFPWDASLYNKKFYLYWGAVPSLLLTTLPARLLAQVGDYHLALGFAFGLAAVLSLLMLEVWRALRPPLWLFALFLAVIGLMTPVTLMLNEGRVYEAAILGCQFFFMAGIFCLYRYFAAAGQPRWLLALGGCLWGLALGTRITIIPVLFLCILVAGYYAWRLPPGGQWRRRLGDAFALGLPLLLALGGMGWYNWARFGDVLELGLRYQLANVDYNVFSASFSPRYFAGNIAGYFLTPIHLQSKYPFLLRTENLFSSDRMAGLLWIAPSLWLILPLLGRLFYAPRAARASLDLPLRWLVTSLALSALAGFAIVFCFYFATMRYIQDFMPALALLLVILTAWEYQHLRAQPAPAFRVWVLAAFTLLTGALTIALNILAAVPRRDAWLLQELLSLLLAAFGRQ